MAQAVFTELLVSSKGRYYNEGILSLMMLEW